MKNKRKKKMRYEKKIRMLQMGIILVVIVLFFVATAAILAKVLSVGKGEAQEAGTQNNIEENVPNSVESEPTQNREVIIPVESTQITISMVGDCTIGTDINFSISKNFNAYYNKTQDYGYFFKNVKDIFAADDLTIVNMEGTLTESEDRQDKTFAFKGAPAFAQILTLGNVEAANLANNHSKDYGWQGYEDTIANLENAGITTFGYERTSVLDVNGIKVGLIGIYELAEGLECQNQLLENINAVTAQGAQIIIVSFHWGSEKSYYPDDIQTALAHLAIDSGADLVVGHHPHVLQGIEEYKGKNIVYSLGNFCFGGNSNPSDKNTMIFQQTFTVENGVLREDNEINIIPCCLSSTWEYNDYCPTPLTGEEAIGVLEKIEEYSAGLSN